MGLFMEVIGVVILFGVLAVVFRLLAGGMDRDRVRDYIESNGGRLLEKRWAPFGKGWFGEKSDRIYEIRFIDSAGNEHEATCKTSLFSGVYLTGDRIVRYAEPPPPPVAPSVSLAEENQRLRAEIARLKREQNQ